MPSERIPLTMRAVILRDYEGMPRSMEYAELQVPALRKGEVLIKMAATPINPSDLVFLRGRYGIVKALPVVPGFEGSGEVIASGGGWLGAWLIGKHVAAKPLENGHGAWAEYMVTAADGCVPLCKGVSDEQAASLIVNPMTASAFIELIRARRQSAFVQTAASSAVGQMVARLALRQRLTAIHVVRREEQVTQLKSLGCAYVFNSNDPLFADRLSEACHKFRAQIALDAVGGELTQQVLAAMPRGSRIIVYGALSGEDCKISPSQFIFSDNGIEGFWLTEWIKRKGFLQKALFAGRVQKLLSTDLRTDVQARFPLSQFNEAILLYKKQRSAGKVLLLPHSGN